MKVPLHDAAQKVPVRAHTHLYNSPPHLQIVGNLIINDEWGLYLDQGTKLGTVILYYDSTLSIFFYVSVTPGNTDIVNSEVVVMPSPNFYALFSIQVDNM